MGMRSAHELRGTFLTHAFAVMAVVIVLTGVAVVVAGVLRDRADVSWLGAGLIVIAAFFGSIAIFASGRSGRVRLSVRTGRLDLESSVNEIVEKRSTTARQKISRKGAAPGRDLT
ncbi:hypothetical protein MTsN4n12_25970 [Microbacterium sp. MTN4-12]